MSQKADTVMVTGATGLLGQQTLRVLTTKYTDLKVKVLIHEESEKKADIVFADLNIEKIRSRQGAAEDAASFQGVQSLFIIPPPVENRVEIVRNIVEAAKKAGVRFILTPSHLSVREKNTVLAQSFKEIENEVKKAGIPHCFIHSEVFMDGILDEDDTIKKTGSFACCIDPDALHNPIATQDLGEVAALILRHPGDHEDTHYTITGPQPLTMTTKAEILGKTIGREIKYVRQTPEQCAQDLVKLGYGQWFSKALAELKQNITTEEEGYTSGDFAKLLERQPISFERFIQEHRNSFLV